MLLQVQNGTLSIKGRTVLSHFDFTIKGNEKIALVGRNGSGKTTLLRLLAGELTLDQDPASSIRIPCPFTTGLLHQQAFPNPTATVEDELLRACPCPDKWDQERFAWEQEYDRILTGFGFKKEDKKKRLCQFSGGEQTKIAFIRLLLEQPKLLLLDEPTNHLDMETVEWLEQYLKSYPHAAVIVSHDRFFLDETVGIVYEIQSCRLTRYAGNYSAYRKQKLKNLCLQEKAWKQQQEEIRRLEELVTRFKNKPKKAAFARSRKKMLERMERTEKPLEDEARTFTDEIVPRIRSSKWVLEAEHLQIGYGKSLLELSLRIRRGQRIGIIGPNGAGKSTFLKTAAGLLPPVKGTCRLGLRVEIGYFSQQTAALSSEKTVLAHFHGLFPVLTEKEARTVLGSFLFSGKDSAKKVSDLSGGEKCRLVLAELFQSRPNFFLLDEPTSHMDIPARETLESALRAYSGTLLFVSHDRYFIRQAADALLVFEADHVSYYPFGYAHYVEHCRKNTNAPDTSARVKAEEQALISGLKSVPKAERHMLREIPQEQAYADWQMQPVLEALEQSRQELEQFLCSLDPFRLYEEPVLAEESARKEEELYQKYTQRCLDWYEKWLELSEPLL